MSIFSSLGRRAEVAAKAVKGQWPGVFISCGMDGMHFAKKGRPCPVCGGNDRFSFTDRWGRGNFICRGCGSGDGFDLISRYCQCSFIEALEIVERFCGIVVQNEDSDVHMELSEFDLQEKEKARERMNLWAQATPIKQGDPVWRYLEKRGLYPPAAGFEIRFHPELDYRHEDGRLTRHPAMLARVFDKHGIVINLHRTYLDGEGNKAVVPRAKKLLPGQIKGGAVHFGGTVGDVLGLAEGIETALAATLLMTMPVWATLGCANLKDFTNIPNSVKRLVIFADNDAKFAGQAAAYAAAHRIATTTAIDVKVLVPDKSGWDWLDELNNRAKSLR